MTGPPKLDGRAAARQLPFYFEGRVFHLSVGLSLCPMQFSPEQAPPRSVDRLHRSRSSSGSSVGKTLSTISR